jgi:hypothetical protein
VTDAAVRAFFRVDQFWSGSEGYLKLFPVSFQGFNLCSQSDLESTFQRNLLQTLFNKAVIAFYAPVCRFAGEVGSVPSYERIFFN